MMIEILSAVNNQQSLSPLTKTNNTVSTSANFLEAVKTSGLAAALSVVSRNDLQELALRKKQAFNSFFNFEEEIEETIEGLLAKLKAKLGKYSR